MTQNELQEIQLQGLALCLLEQIELFAESQRDPEDGTHDPYQRAQEDLEWLETGCDGDYKKILALAYEEFCKLGLVIRSETRFEYE